MKHKTNIKGKNVYYGEGEKLVIVASTPFPHYSQTSLVIYDTLSFVTLPIMNYLNWYFPHRELPGVLNARKVPCTWSSQGTDSHHGQKIKFICFRKTSFVEI
jgi:hypothetical protein